MTAPTIGGISYQEQQGSGRWGGSRKGGYRGTRIYTVQHANVGAFIEGLQGGGGVAVGGLEPLQILPHLWTVGSGIDMYCTEIQDVIPGPGAKLMGSSGVVEAKSGEDIVSAKYETIQLNQAGGIVAQNTVEIQSSSGQEYITVDGQSVKFLDDDDATTAEPMESGNPGVIVAYRQFTVTRKGLLAIPDAAIAACNGLLNAHRFTLRGVAYTKGLVRFSDASDREYVGANGNTFYDLTLTFKVKGRDWNRFWRPKSNRWNFITPLPFSYGNLNSVLGLNEPSV